MNEVGELLAAHDIDVEDEDESWNLAWFVRSLGSSAMYRLTELPTPMYNVFWLVFTQASQEKEQTVDGGSG